MALSLPIVERSAATLAELEAIVADGQETFMRVGRALLEIRSGELYRERGFETFGDYLAARWPRLSRRSAYDALAAAEVEADGVDVAGFGVSHLVELSRLPVAERRRMADLAAARNLTVRELRAIIRELQAKSAPRRPTVVPDFGPPSRLLPAEFCTIDAADCRSLALEDGDAHLDRVRGGPCDPSTCRHPFLVLTSPPYNAGIRYQDDPTGDRLPWRQYWHELVVPHFREVRRILAPGGRYACNLANVLRMDTPELEAQRDGGELIRNQLGGRKWQPPGAGGEPWAHMVDSLIWTTWRRMGLLARERLTWIKTADPDPDDVDDTTTGPENTITLSTAWGTYCSPENPVLRAVAEPVFVASKASHGRERPEGAVSDLDPEQFKLLTRNAWFIPSYVDRSRHPAPWPTELPARLIRLYTWPGDLVVDPMVGTGAAAEAAVLNGRRFYGTDRSPTYVNDALRRVSAAVDAARDLVDQ